MKEHNVRAEELRNAVPVTSNCAQTVMRVYAKEIGLDENLAAAIGSNFGGGMKCGSTCGAITAGYMVLGAKGIESPAVLNEFRSRIAKSTMDSQTVQIFCVQMQPEEVTKKRIVII